VTVLPHEGQTDSKTKGMQNRLSSILKFAVFLGVMVRGMGTSTSRTTTPWGWKLSPELSPRWRRGSPERS
jgi:hypothetical protein